MSLENRVSGRWPMMELLFPWQKVKQENYSESHSIIYQDITWCVLVSMNEAEENILMKRSWHWQWQDWFNFLSDSDKERCIEIVLKWSNLIQFWYDSKFCPTNHSIFAAAFTLNHDEIPLLQYFATPFTMTGLWCANNIGTLPRKLIKQCPCQIKRHQQ